MRHGDTLLALDARGWRAAVHCVACAPCSICPDTWYARTWEMPAGLAKSSPATYVIYGDVRIAVRH